MIKDVEIKKLKHIPDERGFLMEILRKDDQIFKKFGQVYITGCERGFAKAWHYHKKQIDHFVCVLGKSLVVLYDARKRSSTLGKVEKYILDSPASKLRSKNLMLLSIPSGVVHGFTAYHCPETRIVNIPTEVYIYKKPDEYRYPWNSKEIPYQWPKEIKKGG